MICACTVLVIRKENVGEDIYFGQITEGAWPGNTVAVRVSLPTQ